MLRHLYSGLFVITALVGCKGGTPGDTAESSGSSSTGSGDATTQDPSSDPTSASAPSSDPTTTDPSGTITAGETVATTEATTVVTTDGPATTDATTTTSTTGDTTTGDLTATTGATDTSGGPPPNCVPLQCDGKVYECGDCMDNDGDGKYDGADPECISPCDDKEATFATGLPGDNMDPCKQDCFFDGNSGGGAGDCAWNLKCDPESPGGDKCPYDPNFNNCPMQQPEECIMNCQVPNGCDCFGCCTVQVDGMSVDIYIGDPDCSLAEIDKCNTCSKNDDCDDECHPEDCEVCFGQQLPPECEDPTCDVGEIPCQVDDMGGSNCPEGQYCNTGCCAEVVPL